MRTREEINAIRKESRDETNEEQMGNDISFILEVLLDIRELLKSSNDSMILGSFFKK